MYTVAVFIFGRVVSHGVVEQLVSIDVVVPLVRIILNMHRQARFFIVIVLLVEGWDLRQLINSFPLRRVDPRTDLLAASCHLLVKLLLLLQLIHVHILIELGLWVKNVVFLLQGTLDEEFNLSSVNLKFDLELFVRQQKTEEKLVAIK